MTDDRTVLTRRRFVQAGGAATAGLYLTRLTPSARAAGTDAPAYLTRAAYSGLEGTPFTALGGEASLRLRDVADLSRATHEPAFAGRDDAFALSFEGPQDAVLAGGIHELHHDRLGTFAVFIAPVDHVSGAQRYEVVVDRSVKYGEAASVAPGPLAHTNAAATAPARAAGAPAAAGTAKPRPKAPSKLLKGATTSRRAGVITSDVRVAADAGVMSVRATLLKDGVEVARAAKLLRGKAGVRLHLRELRKVPAGTYDLRLTLTDRRGRRQVSTRRVTLR